MRFAAKVTVGRGMTLPYAIRNRVAMTAEEHDAIAYESTPFA